jgi:choline-sulfatase
MKWSALLSVGCALPLASCSGPQPEASYPDVILVVIDTLRAEDLPPYGAPLENAPFMDELARQGVVFDNAWSSSSWTAPATASIFTSRHPNEHGVTRGLLAQRNAGIIELNRISGEVETLPSYFAELGYDTFGVSANINIDDAMGFARGFDRFRCLKEHEGLDASDVQGVVATWMEELEASEAYFLYLHFMDPHEPYRRHAEWVEPDEPPAPHVTLDHAAYRSEIRNVDEHLRAILDALDPDDDTIVIVTADHGQEFLEHGSVGHGFTLYSELTRVPLMIRIGTSGPRGHSSANVSNLDLLPTLRELLHTGQGRHDRGRSLLDVIEADERGQRPIFSMRTSHPVTGPTRLRSIVQGKHKLIHNQMTGEMSLYDLEQDPGESVNLAEQKQDVVRELTELLDLQDDFASKAAVLDSGERNLTAEEIRHLRALGYTGEE